MRFFTVVACFALLIVVNSRKILILRQLQERNPDGSYRYAYETENGINANEEGHLINIGTNEAALIASGFFSYTAPDGQFISVKYTADEFGFHPEGPHIPKPTPQVFRSHQGIANLKIDERFGEKRK